MMDLQKVGWGFIWLGTGTRGTFMQGTFE